MDAAAQRRFLEWLRESPTHVAAYLEIVRVEHDLQTAARNWAGAFRPLEADGLAAPSNIIPLPQMTQPAIAPEKTRPKSKTLRGWLVAAAASIALVGVSIVLATADGQRFGLPKTYSTAHAEQGSWPLPDGSMLHLNSDSIVTVRFSEAERVVTLERGQAMFQVAKDHGRRFRVAAGDTQVIAIGTLFDVYRRPFGTEVVVVEGRVAVLRGPAPRNSPTLELPDATSLRAGEQVVVRSDRPNVPQIMRADLRRARAWTQREIVLEAAPLADVVADFNRYSRIPIEIDGDDLKAIQISGVFGAYDVESLLDFVRHMDGVRVEETSSRIRILSAYPQSPKEPLLVREGREIPASPSGGSSPSGR